MELATYLYDAWAYEQANQGSTDRNFASDEFCGDESAKSNKYESACHLNLFVWNFAAIKRQAYLLSAIAFTGFSGLGASFAPPIAAYALEPSINAAPWCNHIYVCNTSYMLEVQTLLVQRGFAVGEIDGVYGRYTKQAVIDFQRTQTNLIIDGIPGEKTLTLLRQLQGQGRVAPQSPNQNPNQKISNNGAGKQSKQSIVIRRSPNPQNSQANNSTNALETDALETDEIGNLQILLKQRGFYQGEIDGRQEQSTTNAVLKAQKAYGLSLDGFVGPLTMRALLAGGNNIPLSQSAFNQLPSRSTILQIQELLQERGFYDGELNGLYNNLTKASILNAQLAYAQKATGEFSLDLLTALKSQKIVQTDVQELPNAPSSPTIPDTQEPRSSPNNSPPKTSSSKDTQINIQENRQPSNFGQAPSSNQNDPALAPSPPS